MKQRSRRYRMMATLEAAMDHARRSAANFDLNAMLRGAQLTFVGAYRGLQNPALFRSEHYRQAGLAVCIGLGLQILLSVPILAVKVLLRAASFVIDLDQSSWDDAVIQTIEFTQNTVLQVPLFLVFALNYFSPALDGLFLESLRWVDLTYYRKHANETASSLRSGYYDNFVQYSTRSNDGKGPVLQDAFNRFLRRTTKRTLTSLIVFGLAYVPYVGFIVLPAATAYTFRQKVGTIPAVVVFSIGHCLPKHYLVSFLTHYFATRSLMRELLEPYFARIKFNSHQRQRWFRDREGVLFGFGIVLLLLIRIPIFGVLIYGIAQASAAFLITKITDPPPPPEGDVNFAESQTKWTNKHAFLRLPLMNIDSEPQSIGRSGETSHMHGQAVYVKNYS